MLCSSYTDLIELCDEYSIQYVSITCSVICANTTSLLVLHVDSFLYINLYMTQIIVCSLQV